MRDASVVRVEPGQRLLSASEFQRLADVPPEAQWFANLDSAQTRRAYQSDLKAFMAFTGIVQPEEFRTVTRGHVLAWRVQPSGASWRPSPLCMTTCARPMPSHTTQSRV